MGNLVAMTTAPTLIAAAGWPASFWVYGALGLAWAAAWFPLVDDARPPKPEGGNPKLRHSEETGFVVMEFYALVVQLVAVRHSIVAEAGPCMWKAARRPKPGKPIKTHDRWHMQQVAWQTVASYFATLDIHCKLVAVLEWRWVPQNIEIL